MICGEQKTRLQLVAHLQMEVQHDDHLPVAGLEYGVFDVVVQDVDFIAAYRRETEAWRDTKRVVVCD